MDNQPLINKLIRILRFDEEAIYVPPLKLQSRQHYTSPKSYFRYKRTAKTAHVSGTMTPPSPQGPPGPDECIIGSLLGPLIPIHILSTLLVGMRLYTRARPVMQLSRDDAAVTLALVRSLFCWARSG